MIFQLHIKYVDSQHRVLFKDDSHAMPLVKSQIMIESHGLFECMPCTKNIFQSTVMFVQQQTIVSWGESMV